MTFFLDLTSFGLLSRKYSRIGGLGAPEAATALPGSFAPQFLQKTASGTLAEPHFSQTVPFRAIPTMCTKGRDISSFFLQCGKGDSVPGLRLRVTLYRFTNRRASVKRIKFEEVGRLSFNPRYLEERPPAYFGTLMSARERAESPEARDTLTQLAYIVLLGRCPSTIISIVGFLRDNGNEPLYGSELGRLMERTYGLPTGSCTKGRYYEDRVGRVLRGLAEVGVLEEVKIHPTGTRRIRNGFKLSSEYYQKLSSELVGRDLASVAALPSGAKTIRVCARDGFVPLDPKASHCQYCGGALHLACSNCGTRMAQMEKYCIGCGENLG